MTVVNVKLQFKNNKNELEFRTFAMEKIFILPIQ